MISGNDNIHFSRLVNSDPCCCSLTSEPLADQSYCGIIQVPYLLGCAEDMGIWVYRFYDHDQSSWILGREEALYNFFTNLH